jgi:CDP-4-dehydro-6-deoxyglucose reductase/ferredoxin-NAD(P)+ reductase (naphthalene dioxygenase ferredoxin-specific)
MANPPHDPVLEFHVRRTANGLASNHVWRTLAAGDRVQVEGPLGTCYLRERHTAPILLAGGGSGMAPMLSILESALHLGMTQPIRLYFGVREALDVYATDRLDELAARHANFRYDIALSGPIDAAALGRYRTGMLHEVIAADWDRLSIGKSYLAGPPVMVEAVSTLLRSRGVALRDIHADAYYTEADKAKLQPHPARTGGV